jgi:hypothetical protein
MIQNSFCFSDIQRKPLGHFIQRKWAVGAGVTANKFDDRLGDRS